MLTIYHNPRCSKSRETLQLLTDRGQTPTVVLYLETPPTRAELTALLKQLGLRPQELLRKQEAEYKELGLEQPGSSDRQALDAMLSHPRLMERPIVSDGQRAVIGRPPESVLELLK
jgi:arsenate reductase